MLDHEMAHTIMMFNRVIVEN